MTSLQRFIDVTGITEEEALSALVAAFSPPQLGPLRQNWSRQPQFGHSAPATAVLRQLFEAADYRCTLCQSQLRLGIDHVNSHGADHTPENLRVLCFSCNRARGRGAVENVHHGRRVAAAILELFDETGRFPSSAEIRQRAGVTTTGRPELVAFLRKRLTGQ
jgi:hypothetical protein